MALLPHLITSHYIVSTQVETSGYINYYKNKPQIPTVLTTKNKGANAKENNIEIQGTSDVKI